MKSFFYFLSPLLLLLSFTCYAPDEKKDSSQNSKDNSSVQNKNDTLDWKSLRSDSIKIIPKGKIKSMNEYSYSGTKFGIKLSDTVGLHIKHESKNGNTTFYDTVGNILYEKCYGSKKKYFYTTGKLVKVIDTTDIMIEDFYKSTSICLMKYNAKGQCIKKSTSRVKYGKRGEEKYQLDSLFTYDQKGNLTTCVCEQDRYGRIKYEYDSLNRQTQGTYCSRFGVIRHSYRYDEKGRRIEEKTFARDTLIQRWCYNVSGTIKEDSTIDNTGRLTSTGFAFYFYDKFGNIIYSERYYSDPRRHLPHDKWESKFTYDANGNWIRQVTYLNGEVWEIKGRLIEYF